MDRVDRLAADVVDLLPGVEWTSKLLGARLLHLSNLVEEYYSEVCAQFGVSLTGHSVLTTLRRHAPAQMTLAEINEEALVTSGGITFVARQLENLGLVARRPHPDDRRSVQLRLTAEGRRVADRVIAAVAKADESIFAEISRQDRRSAEELLRVIERGVDHALWRHRR